MRLAANGARNKLFEVAGTLLKAKPEDLDAADGKIFVKAQPSKSVPFKQAAAKILGVSVRTLQRKEKQL